jgi:DNA-binding XRE family transcriptional regulator
MDRHELRQIRRSWGLTQAQMAALIGTRPATVTKLEAGTLDLSASKRLLRLIISRDFWLARETDKLQRKRSG